MPEVVPDLKQYFTNPHGRVTALTSAVGQVDAGAMFARYSRSQDSAEDLLLKEFLNNPNKGENFYQTVLAQYGDDSVAELGGAHLSFAGISQLAAKEIEDVRIGLSPLEKSTRYVTFAKKDSEGKFQYVREPKIMEKYPVLFEETCDSLFDSHVKSFDTVHSWVLENYPQKEGEKEIGFKQSRRAKALDITRGLLPAAAKTNVGLYGNGRAFEYLLIKMSASPLQESQELAGFAHEELDKVIPAFVKRVTDDTYGKAHVDFLKNRDARVRQVATELLGKEKPYEVDEVILMNFRTPEEQIVSRILYEGSELPMAQIHNKVKGFGEDEIRMVVDAYLNGRSNRRHKPGRAFETMPFVFDVNSDFGIFRDLQRHRMQSQMRQRLTTKLGYDTPPEIKRLGMEGDWKASMETADKAFREIEKELPFEAQYAVPLASNLRWYMAMNPRELFWMTEIRTGPQGHPNYRRVANRMWDLAAKEHPLLFNSDIVQGNRKACEQSYLERQSSEQKIDEKLARLGVERKD